MTSEIHPLPDIGAEYHIQRYWRSSGEADLYIAWHRVEGGRHVVKILRSVQEADREPYLRWVERQKALRHPRILAIKDAGLAKDPPGKPFVVTEYFIWKNTLRDLVKVLGSLHPRLAEDITKAILEGLDHAQRQNPPVLHRDLKPENVLLVSTHRSLRDLKLIDFSMAATDAYRISGTPPYQSPEQTLRVSELTPASDIFSVGAIFYELLTGRPPFLGDSSAAMRGRIRNDEVDLRNNRIDAYQAGFLRRCLAKHPSQRFPSAGEAFEFLQAKPATMPSNSQLPKLAAGILLAMIGVVLLGLLLVAVGDRADSSAERRREGSTPKDRIEESRRSIPPVDRRPSRTTAVSQDQLQQRDEIDIYVPFTLLRGDSEVAASSASSSGPFWFGGGALTIESSGCRGTRTTKPCLLAVFGDDGRLAFEPNWISSGDEIVLGREGLTLGSDYVLILSRRSWLRGLRERYGLGSEDRTERLAPHLFDYRNSLSYLTLRYLP